MISRGSFGLLDTSVVIAQEAGRALKTDLMPDQAAICVITVAELQAGVLAATNTTIRALRLATLNKVSAMEPLPVDIAAATQWAMLRVRLAEAGRRAKGNDLWIAAIALANGLPVITQDDDFDPIKAVGGPQVIRV